MSQDTSSNQAALDAAADDAATIAGPLYYTEAAIDTTTNLVHVYLAGAPQVTLIALQSAHPNLYVVHNTAAHPRSALLSLEDQMMADADSLLTNYGVNISYLGPTAAGRLEVGVTSDVTAATVKLDSAYGTDWVSVVADNDPARYNTYRYNDVAPWNGGDFIYHQTTTQFSDCSSGIPMKSTSDGTNYMLTASHCFWMFEGGVGKKIWNGYVEGDNGTVYPNSSKTLIGTVAKTDDISGGTHSLDSALIKTSVSLVDFDCAWNCAGRAIQIGTHQNHVGDIVCTSGAFEGQICNIKITKLDVAQRHLINCIEMCTYNWVIHLAKAQPPNSSTRVATGEGDSGGPVYSWDGSHLLARGMMEGSNSASIPCTSTPPGTSSRTCYNISYFVEISYIMSHWGITPRT